MGSTNTSVEAPNAAPAEAGAGADDSRQLKLESLGLLARGFAHDFNNILTVLLGHLSLAETDGPADPGYLEELRGAREAASRAQRMVQQLLTFAKGGAPLKRQHDLNALIREVAANGSADSPVLLLVPSRLDAAVDREQIWRLLENLLKNAVQATTSGARDSIQISSALLDRANPPVRVLPSNLDASAEYAVIGVHDEGEGVVPENLARIFDPFFSTREDTYASGLGLAVCESIARAHGGAMAVDSEPGVRTAFYVFLPILTDDTEEIARSNGTSATTPEGKRGRILILEDDSQVRRLIVQTLWRRGFETKETEEGGEAVAAYAAAWESGAPFDLLIMDLSIPGGMGGAEALQRILAINPDARAIVSSGYFDDPVMATHRRYGFAAVLPKPYEPAALVRIVEETIPARKNTPGP